ncbi:MAG: MMPL family transporter, partial [Pseudomonadota bacterium]
TAALTLLFIYGLGKNLSVKVLLEEMVPPAHPFVKLHLEYESQYGGTSTVIVSLVVKDGDIFNAATLQKIKRINDELLFNTNVRRALVSSIAQRKSKVAKGHAGGTVDVSALMWPEIDTTPEGIERLKHNIFTNDLYNGALVSKDGKAAMFIADCWNDINYSEFFEAMQQLKQREEDGNTTIHFAGRPMLMGWIYHFMPGLMVIFAATAIFIVLAVAFIFRNIIGIVIPMLAGALSAVWGFGLIALCNVNFNPLMIVLVILVGARALSHSVQTTRRYLEELFLADGDRMKAAVATIDGIFLASLAAIVTDAAGFSVLILAKIPMVQKIAILCSFWVMAILLIVSGLGPLLCLYMPNPKNLKKYSFSWDKGDLGKGDELTQTTGWIDGIARLCINRKSAFALVGGMILLGLLTLPYDSKLRIGDTNPGSPILWPDSVYNQDCKIINAKFDNSGTDLLSIIVEGSEDDIVEEPAVMKRIDQYERFITSKYPDLVGGTQSIAKIVKTLNKEFHEGDVRYFTIPDDKRLITNLMFFYAMGGDPSDFTTYVEARYKHTIIRVFLKDHQGETLDKVIAATDEFFKSQPEIKGVKFRFAAGYGGILAATNEEVRASQTGTLLFCFITVFIFCAIAYRSMVAALILCIPLMVANLVAVVYMVFKDVGLDLNALPVAAVGIGVGVDYGIYILSRMEEEFKNTGGDWERMIHTSLNSAGKGVVITAITVIVPVMLWPLLADLKFQAEMGLLLTFIMFFDMLGALFFIPACVILFKPKFIKKHAHLTDEQIAAAASARAAREIEIIGSAIENPFFAAVFSGDQFGVKKLLSGGLNANIGTAEGYTLLMEAVKIPQQETRTAIVKMLLDAGVNVRSHYKNGISALHLAAICGFDDTVRMLITYGAELNDGATVKDRPLGKALLHGNIKSVECLIHEGAEVTEDVIRFVAEQNSPEFEPIAESMLRLLMSKNMHLNKAIESGKTVRDILQQIKGVEELIKKIDRLKSSKAT